MFKRTYIVSLLIRQGKRLQIALRSLGVGRVISRFFLSHSGNSIYGNSKNTITHNSNQGYSVANQGY
jgi:hypothetical protein